MDQDEDDWRGSLEFWLDEISVSPDIFRGLFYDVEDLCTQPHICAGRVSGGFIPHHEIFN